MNIINGMRPKIVPRTPLEYKNLMEQCWDADSLKRPKLNTLLNTISEINSSYQNISDELSANDNLKIIFYSKLYEFNIPNNIGDFVNSDNQNYISGSKISSILSGNIQNDYKRKLLQEQIIRQYSEINDKDDEIYINPNLHSENDEFEIPEGLYNTLI
ncbi:kinase-like domain-containing protein [Rhizophagus clarus]|uniref:Kinase-like domain-containing protein n=1 Tax=Rhizophagus clarus TaxID=94130 RepID=A0A8H3LX40_9GLOM|nr:kinase-like domain-containing protein [Rhizophagus clarus]